MQTLGATLSNTAGHEQLLSKKTSCPGFKVQGSERFRKPSSCLQELGIREDGSSIAMKVQHNKPETGLALKPSEKYLHIEIPYKPQ